MDEMERIINEEDLNSTRRVTMHTINNTKDTFETKTKKIK